MIYFGQFLTFVDCFLIIPVCLTLVNSKSKVRELQFELSVVWVKKKLSLSNLYPLQWITFILFYIYSGCLKEKPPFLSKHTHILRWQMRIFDDTSNDLIWWNTVKHVLSGHSKIDKNIFLKIVSEYDQNRLSLNAGQKYCRMLQWWAFCYTFDLHSAIIEQGISYQNLYFINSKELLGNLILVTN